MNIEEIETKIASLEDTLGKVKALVADAKICNSEITRALISSAVKKYATAISEFKLD